MAVFIDGLDESEGHDIQEEMLRAIRTSYPDQSIPLRFFVTSRPEPHLHESPLYSRGLGSFNMQQSFEDIRIRMPREYEIPRETANDQQDRADSFGNEANNAVVREQESEPGLGVDSQGKLRTPTEDRESPEKELNPFIPTHSESPSPVPSGVSNHEDQEDDGTNPALSAVQSQNARSPPWLPWHDRALITEAEKHRPFNAARGDASRNAWETLAVELLKSSTLNGTPINRTGAACRARFQKLVKAHKGDETRSLQKTGTDEEVNEHTEVVELIQARELEKDERSTASRKKADVETKAALELRDAAMKGLVRRDRLTDVAQLEGASVREKQGQRSHKYDETTSDSEKENMSDADEKPRRKRGRNQLLEIV
ncbi:hypothetical protein B0H16DRAFT_1736055 [Mycena metata]|uniref:Myb-like domain-containing protein n=1 Tax=Mycena metata TaxID=1033252 RepID=A0AAD7MNI2_9AGAR|nr:hypothetical protein B0H16DRAFT_1736055 [Mycena metata]